MKILAGDLTDIVFDAFNRGISMGRAQKDAETRDSIQALVSENSQLKRELETIESRAKTQVMTAGQRSSFSAVREEQRRIVAAIRKHFSTPDSDGPAWAPDMIEELLFVLALGDIK